MKNAKEYISKLNEEEVIEAEETTIVQSSSDTSKKYVLVKIDGVWTCECIGFGMRGHCKHIDKKNEKN